MPRGATPAAYPRVQTSRASSPLLFGLAPRGVFRAPDVAIGAVGSYPTFSPLPESAREAKTSRRFTCAISPCGANRRFKFLWHYPSPAYASTVSYAVRAACKLERPGVTRRVAPCPRGPRSEPKGFIPDHARRERLALLRWCPDFPPALM